MNAHRRRRLRAREGSRGWCHASIGVAREVNTLGSSGDYLGADACRRADGGIPDGGFLGQVYAGAEFAATITAPVMKGRRGGAIPNGNFRADVHRVAFITPLMIAELPGTAKLPFTETKTATRRSPYAHHEGLPFLK